MTLGATDSRVESLVDRLTTAPPAGAIVLSLAVSNTWVPPLTVTCGGESESRMGGGVGTSTLLLEAF